MSDKQPKYSELVIETLLSSRTKRGMINLRLDGTTIQQWDVPKAREVWRMLTEAIEAAVSDEMIYRFLREEVGLSEEAAGHGLIRFRRIRQGDSKAVFPQ